MVDFERGGSASHHHRQHELAGPSPVEGFLVSDHIPAAAAALFAQDEPLDGFSSGALSGVDSSPYYKAKVAENSRDYKSALYWHSVCIDKGIRATSAIMDVAGILNKFGREQEALIFMEKYKHLVPQDRYQGFKRLYDRVQFNICRPSQSLPRMLKVVFVPPRGIPPEGVYTGDPPQFHTPHALAIFGALEEGPLDMKILDRLFPNPEKIECLAVTEPEPGTGTQVAYVQFESQSSARKALMTEKTSSVLPPLDDDEGVVGIKIVHNKDRCITSPFESSLVLYVVRCGWKPPPSETSTSPRPSQPFAQKDQPRSSRSTASLSVQSPRRYDDSWEAHTSDLSAVLPAVPMVSPMSLGTSESPSGVDSTCSPTGVRDTSALMFSKKMITAMKLLDEFTGGAPSTSESFAVAEGCESVGRFDLAFGLYADVAAEIAEGDSSVDAPRVLIECVIRCAVIAAIWGGSFETGCRILDCIITTSPSLTFLTRAASNLASVLGGDDAL
ncbi:hypothetical protein FOL47_008497 [Perkinsus chesapeaki]|uniref:Uncharacterized protein n=1 Tax=Perkinsus chesapeaki TaxID=330153 RepID=A0A7J6MTI4_PERCH|nr:hypothetical protein FOL47_008497 [Perkinsus chesapeaki]